MSTTVPTEALEISESTYALATDSVDFPTELQEARVQRLVDHGMSLEEASATEEDERSKLVPLHIIRPGVGRGRGRHIYEAKMLSENAENFRGWRQYIDHLSPEARRAAKGLPRSIRDLGGRIVESYWDPNVPEDPAKGFGRGAVVGWSLPTPMVRELIDNDPEIVEASIHANATGVQPVERDGKRAWLVEGIEKKGSVDWVTEAGAGGRVVALMEAAYEEDDHMELLEAMTDEEFIAYVQEQRPHLLSEADSAADAKEDAADNGDDEVAELAAKLMKKNPKLNRQQAEAMAKRSLAEATTTEGDTMGEFTPETLREALQSEDFRGVLDEVVQERAKPLIEAAVNDERELIRAEAKADADRQIALRDMRDDARKLIEAARLPDVFAARARAEYDLTDRGPTAKLNVVDDVDDDGKVTKTAHDKLQESVAETVQSQRELLAAANPTRVTGQGPGTAARRGADGEQEEPKKGDGTLYGSVLQEAGIDPSTAWDA